MNTGWKDFLVLATSFFATTALAADFDGSEALICSFGQVIECEPGSSCHVVTHESVDAPDFVKLDFRRNQMVSVAAGEDSPADDMGVTNTTTHLVVQGVQGIDEGISTLGWSLSIDHASGQMVAAGAGNNAGFVIFGACHAI